MRRGRYWLAFGLLLLVEVLIAQYVHDRFVRPYLGDVLVILQLYCLGRGIGIRSRWLAFGVTLLGPAGPGGRFCAAGDIGQYLRLGGSGLLSGGRTAPAGLGTGNAPETKHRSGHLTAPVSSVEKAGF